MKGRDKGFVTVFITLLVMVLFVLITCALRVVLTENAKTKAVIAARASLSDVKANYNSYIFEHYHILLFDKNYRGGEGYLEEMMQKHMTSNLGEEADVENISIAGFDMIYDQDCQNLKNQIAEYALYGLAEYGVEDILAKTDGEDGSAYALLQEEMDNQNEGDQLDDDQFEDVIQNSGEETEGFHIDDPRDYTKDLSDLGLMQIVVPEGLEVSEAKIDMSDSPSRLLHSLSVFNLEFNRSFDDYSDLKKDLNSRARWIDNLVHDGELPVYAGYVFNSALTKVNDSTVFQMEQEYLIHGSNSDAENLKAVVKQIIAVRFPLNYGYLISDKTKMAEVRSVAVPLSVITLIPEPILKYLLAGCWAYVESVVDVRSLLAGKRIAFKKTASTWKTSLTHLEDCENCYGTENSGGLSYDDYLMILMVFRLDVLPYRMLDLMQLNVRQEQEDFSMLDAAVGIRVDYDVSCGGRTLQFTQYDYY